MTFNEEGKPSLSHQRRLLKAVALEGEVQAPTASDFIHRYDLGSAASVQRSMKRLIERDILDKQGAGLAFTDAFMRDWIRLKIA